jgi:hypothetical protein
LLAGEVLINEIMYHAASQDQRDEFVEIFNSGPLPVNLAGWRFDTGVDFAFPDRSIAPGEYLVIAADLARFQATHPGVENVVGGYSGRLSNSGERIALVNSGGELVDEVAYADEGDWGVRAVGPLDLGHHGWVWSAEHDGGGKSIELVNAALSNDQGQNWVASVPDGGTPGAANSVRKSDVAPLVLDFAHLPAIPRSSDTVTVRARIVDELATGIVASLFHRVDGESAFTQALMFDDGLHGDGLAADGTYGAVLPPHPNGTVVEFFVQAGDAAGNSRMYPAGPQSAGEPLAKLLYQVDDAVDTGSQPIYRLIMTEAERAELADIGSHPVDPPFEYLSNAQMNGTFISVDSGGIEVLYNVGIRNRGRGGRLQQPNNYRVNFPNDRRWHDVTSIALDGRYSGLEVAGSMILRQGGVDAQDAIPVAVRVNGSDLAVGAGPAFRMYGSYAHMEALDSDFAENHYALDADGNLYRGFDGLVYRGDEPDAYRAELHFGIGYEKQTNQEDDNWQDLISLLKAFDRNQTADELFAERIEEVIDVKQWIRAIAMHELIGNRENSLPIGVGDDFSLYRGTIDTRFRLISHDLDTILGLGDTIGGETLPIFRATRLDALERLLKHPQFAPLYFAALDELSRTVLAPENINPLLDNWLGGQFSTADIERAKQFLVARRNHILNPADPLVPLALTVISELPVENDYRTTSAAATDLGGRSNAIRTRSVLVNGEPATWTAWQATWSAQNVPLRPGVNRLLVQSLDEHGVEFERSYLDIFRNTGAMTNVAGTLPAGETRWTVGAAPYHVTGTVTVPAGATLRIDPGVTVFFDAGAGLVVSGGQLLAEGTDVARIQLTRTPGQATNWRGIRLSDTNAPNRISYTDQAFGDAGFGGGARSFSATNSRIDIEHMTWSGTMQQVLNFVDSSFRVSNSVLPDVGEVEPVHGVGVPAGGYAIFEGNHFGRNRGYNDTIDFSEVQQPNSVLQVLGNVFAGGEDDILDLDGCDAYIEGNVFMGAHLTDPANPDTSSAVSGGQFNGLTSRWTIVRNYFYDLDHAVLLKEGAFAKIVNNTMVNLSVAAINFDEPAGGDIEPGLGASLDGNIIWATPLAFENVDSDGTTTALTVNRSILPGTTINPGIGNSNLDPHLIKTTGITDPVQDLKLQSGFGPARGTGPNGRDMGADVPAGASIGGVPARPTSLTSATLKVGGPENVAYRYRFNGGAWSNVIAVATPIALTGLPGGVQTLEVVARNAAGVWQAESAATVATWTVDTDFAPGLRISEVLAQNTGAVNHQGTFPDLIELVNEGPTAIDLAGMSITDNASQPRKYVFRTSTVLAAGARLVLFADDPNATTGIHLGFALSREGEGVHLFNSPAAGGGLADSVSFGPQLANIALARRPDDSWGIGAPSFGAPNVLLPMGNPQNLRINEWLAAHDAPFNNDLIELYNSDTLPVDLGGLHLTDNPNGWPDRHVIAPLSFVASRGLFVFTADDDPEQGADHVSFRLASEQGMIGLFGQGVAVASGDPVPIDVVLYGPQTTNVSQGRTPDGRADWAYFTQPTFGAANRIVPPLTIYGTADRDTFHVVRSGSQLHVYDSLSIMGAPEYSFELATPGGTLTIDLLGGDDALVVNSGGQADLGVAVMYSAGSGINTLVLAGGAARVDGAAPGGTLNTSVAAGAHLSTARLSQNELTLAAGSRVTLLPGGGTSVITRLSLDPGAALDIADNALVIDYEGESPIAAIREQIITGRGGAGVGNGTWTGAGITSSTAAAANAINAESRSLGFAENASLPLGPYSTFRGQSVDQTAVLIAYTHTGDANLDGLVSDDDVTIAGATYSPGAANPQWSLGDFDFNGFVNDDDVTLLGAFYNPAAPLPAPPVVAWSPDYATAATAGLKTSRAVLETFGHNAVRGQVPRAQHTFRKQHMSRVERPAVDPELVDLLARSIHADQPNSLQFQGFRSSKKLRDQGFRIG